MTIIVTVVIDITIVIPIAIAVYYYKKFTNLSR
jgi:hypothetical protein